MPISVTCPNCGTKLKAPDEHAGKRAKCKKCETKFLVTGPTVAAAPGDSIGLSVSDSQGIQTISNPFSFDGSAETPAVKVVTPEAVTTAPSDNPFAVHVPITDPNPSKSSKANIRKSSKKGLAPKGDTNTEQKPRGYQANKGGGSGVKIMIGAVLGAIIVGGGGAAYFFLFDKKPAEQAKATTPPTKAEPPSDAKEKTGKKGVNARKQGEEDEPEKGKALNLGGGLDRKKDAAMPVAAPSRPGVKVTGPAIPEAPRGEMLIAKAEAYALVPGPADKLAKVVINRAGSMAVSLHRSFDGFAGKGATDTCERFALPSGAPAGKFEIPADGVTWPRAVALAQDGSKLAIEGPPGKIAIWDLNDESKKEKEAEFEPFPPEKGKPTSAAAVYFLDETHLVVIGPMGQMTGYDTTKKEKTIEGAAILNMPESLMAGRNITITADGKMVVMVANGKLFEVPTSSGRALGGNTIYTRAHTVLATAVDPAGARVLVATEDDSGIRVALFPVGADKPKASFVFPSGIGKPVRAAWLGNDMVSISTNENPGAVIFDAENGRWTAYVRRPGKPDAKAILQTQDPEKDWHLAPDEAGKLRLLAVEWPFDSYFSERDLSAKGVMSFVQTAEGLKK